MAIHFSCKCPERKKPVNERAWVVTQYHWTTGSFSPKGGEWSQYSQVYCLECGATGRSKSKYVEELEHMDHFKAYEERDRRVALKGTEPMTVCVGFYPVDDDLRNTQCDHRNGTQCSFFTNQQCNYNDS